MRKMILALLLVVLPAQLMASDIPDALKESTDFQVNFDTVRERLESSSFTMMTAQNRLSRAKLSVESARGRLFPSINLGVVAGTLADTSFVLASVEYMIPFLIPQRWFDLRKAKAMQQAEAFSYLTTELNLYASTYSLISNILNDFETRNIVYQDLRDSIAIEDLVSRNVEDGSATDMDLSRAKSQTAAVQIRLARVNELLVDEISQLKQVLNLSPETKLSFKQMQVQDPHIDKVALKDLVEKAQEASPELKQVKFLVKSAKAEKESKLFAFISGITAGNSTRGMAPGEDASFAFSRQTITGMFNFGLDYFPNYEIAKSMLKDLEIRQQEVQSELTKTVSSLVGRYNFVLKRYQESQSAEELLSDVFVSDQVRYQQGEIPLIQLMDSQAKLRQSSLERLRAQTDIQLLWLAAHRVLVTGEFTEAKGCQVLPKVTPRRKIGPPWNRRWEPRAVCDPKSTSMKYYGNYSEPEGNLN